MAGTRVAPAVWQKDKFDSRSGHKSTLRRVLQAGQVCARGTCPCLPCGTRGSARSARVAAAEDVDAPGWGAAPAGPTVVSVAALLPVLSAVDALAAKLLADGPPGRGGAGPAATTAWPPKGRLRPRLRRGSADGGGGGSGGAGAAGWGDGDGSVGNGAGVPRQGWGPSDDSDSGSDTSDGEEAREEGPELDCDSTDPVSSRCRQSALLPRTPRAGFFVRCHKAMRTRSPAGLALLIITSLVHAHTHTYTHTHAHTHFQPAAHAALHILAALRDCGDAPPTSPTMP
jgi:hypothetical protein